MHGERVRAVAAGGVEDGEGGGGEGGGGEGGGMLATAGGVRAEKRRQKEAAARAALYQVGAGWLPRSGGSTRLHAPVRRSRPGLSLAHHRSPSSVQRVAKKAIGYGDIYTGELFMGYPSDGLLEYAHGLRQAIQPRHRGQPPPRLRG